jgi:hypothetical protein
MSNYINFQPITKLTKLAINPPGRVIRPEDIARDPEGFRRHLDIHRQRQEMMDAIRANEEARIQRERGFREGLRPPRMDIPIDVPGVAGIGGPLGMNPENMGPFMLRTLPPHVREQILIKMRENPDEAWKMLVMYYSGISRKRPLAINMLMSGNPDVVAKAIAAARALNMPIDQADLALAFVLWQEEVGADQQPAQGQPPPGQGLLPPIQPNARDREIALAVNPQIIAMGQAQQAALQQLNANVARIGVRQGALSGGLPTLEVANEDNLKAYEDNLKAVANKQPPGLPESYNIAAALSLRAIERHREQARPHDNPDEIVRTFSEIMDGAAKDNTLKIFVTVGNTEVHIGDQRIPQNLKDILVNKLTEGWKVTQLLGNNPNAPELKDPRARALLARVVFLEPVVINVQGQGGRMIAIVPTTALNLLNRYESTNNADDKQRIAEIMKINVQALQNTLPPIVRVEAFPR